MGLKRPWCLPVHPLLTRCSSSVIAWSTSSVLVLDCSQTITCFWSTNSSKLDCKFVRMTHFDGCSLLFTCQTPQALLPVGEFLMWQCDGSVTNTQVHRCTRHHTFIQRLLSSQSG